MFLVGDWICSGVYTGIVTYSLGWKTPRICVYYFSSTDFEQLVVPCLGIELHTIVQSEILASLLFTSNIEWHDFSPSIMPICWKGTSKADRARLSSSCKCCFLNHFLFSCHLCYVEKDYLISYHFSFGSGKLSLRKKNTVNNGLIQCDAGVEFPMCLLKSTARCKYRSTSLFRKILKHAYIFSIQFLKQT